MIVLAFDTSAAHCAAALFSGNRIVATRSEVMSRGQAERLMPLVQAMLTEAGSGWTELDRIGVGIGPGNFTGVRIAVSAARGLALGRGIPAIGVSGFDVIAHRDPGRDAAIPAPRGQVYHCPPGGAPMLRPAEDIHDAATLPDPSEHAATIATLAAVASPGARPAPLYLRPADAARARGHGPRLIG